MLGSAHRRTREAQWLTALDSIAERMLRLHRAPRGARTAIGEARRSARESDRFGPALARTAATVPPAVAP